jgi:hypothetical protein
VRIPVEEFKITSAKPLIVIIRCGWDKEDAVSRDVSFAWCEMWLALCKHLEIYCALLTHIWHAKKS